MLADCCSTLAIGTGGGLHPIDSTAIQTAMDALTQIMSHNSSLPQWTPTQRSGVQLTTGAETALIWKLHLSQVRAKATLSSTIEISPTWSGMGSSASI